MRITDFKPGYFYRRETIAGLVAYYVVEARFCPVECRPLAIYRFTGSLGRRSVLEPTFSRYYVPTYAEVVADDWEEVGTVEETTREKNDKRNERRKRKSESIR